MQDQVAENKFKSWLIMLGFVMFVGAIGWIFAQFVQSPGLVYVVLTGAAVYALVMYFAGSRISLAVNGAKEVSEKDNPRLYRIVHELSQIENVPMPKVYVMDDPAPNAFATGRNPNHAAVCATTGILEIMDDNELRGVFAHEMGHVKNYDIRVSMIAAALAMVVSFIADMIFHSLWFRGNDDRGNNSLGGLAIIAAIVAPIVAGLIQLAITRRREFLADATGAQETRHPEYLASALEKIGHYGSATRRQNTATAHLFFANPLRTGAGLRNLFSTHPPLEERIRRLREMAAGA